VQASLGGLFRKDIMLHIVGAIQLMPTQVGVEAGLLNSDEGEKQKAIVFTFDTHSGPVQAIIPYEMIDQFIEGLQETKKEAEKLSTEDIIVASNLDGVKTQVPEPGAE
jgi:hypothetical protein